ncbi:MAG: Hsp70 family protein [Ruminococcus sp.]
MAIIGIDLGTTNSLAACRRNGKTELIRNSIGDAFTPSAVSIDDDEDVLVGRIAVERLISHPDRSASEFKRYIGQRREITLGGKSFTPEELSSLVLKKIKSDAEKYLGESVDEAVISVPAYFDDNARSATKLAAELAGLKAERLVNEPSAAALAYLAAHDFRAGTYLIVDFGGGTLDVSVVDAFDSIIEILAVAGDNHIGGKDFNEAIAHYFCTVNEIDYNALSPDSRAVIYKTAESCKRTLSELPMTIMAANIDGKQYSMTLDNNKLIEISSDIFGRISAPIKKVLRDSRCSMSEIDDIILVGGSCKMPTVQAFIEKITGKSPCTDINPETAVAVGAGIFAGIKSRNEELKDVILTDICPFSLGTSTLDETSGELVMSFIIERNTALPASREQTFSAIRDGQSKVKIDIYQGESILPKKNLFLGELEVDCPPAKKHTPICRVRMTYDVNGILMVDVITIGDGKTSTKLFSGNRGTLSGEEADKCRRHMESLRILPAEKEQNRLLIARAERAFEEALSIEREMIQHHLNLFRAALKLGSGHEIRRTYSALSTLLDRFDNMGEL